MKLLRSAAAIGIGKAIYDQLKKPENQAKIKSAMDRKKQSGRTTPRRSH